MRYFIRSVGFAFQGMFSFFRNERNGQIQGVIALLAVAAGTFLHLRRREWIVLLFCIAAVISLEMLNSTIERLCNKYTTEFDPEIKIIKDVAAAAVLWTAIIAAVVGIILFYPHVQKLVS